MSGDANGAEKVFREDLVIHPRNPRSLYGLHQALGRSYDAGFVEKQFHNSWKGGEMKMEDLV